MMYYNIITNLEDAIWYLEHEECIETYEQVEDIDRIITDNLYRLSNKKYYIEKCDKLRYEWYKKL